MFSERTHGILCEMASSSYILGKDVQEAFGSRYERDTRVESNARSAHPPAHCNQAPHLLSCRASTVGSTHSNLVEGGIDRSPEFLKKAKAAWL